MNCCANENRVILESLSYDKHFIDFFNSSRENETIGRVHSIFNKVVNFINNKDKMFSIALKEIDNAPFTLRINNKNNFSFNSLQLKENSLIIKHENNLIVSNILFISIQNYMEWKSHELSIKVISRDIINKNVSIFNEIIVDRYSVGGCRYFYLKNFLGCGHNHPNIVEKKLSEKIEKFIKEIDKDSLRHNLESLIGLGSGLTPSGDDFLTGFITTIGIVDIPHISNKFLEIKNSIDLNRASTTDVGKQMLSVAIQRESRENVSNLIYSFLKDNETEFRECLEKVLSIGSSSGTDLSIGIITAFIYIII